jgi:hypothetical protein
MVLFRCWVAFNIYNDLAGKTTAIVILALCISALIILSYLGLRAFLAAAEIERVIAVVEKQVRASA